MSSNTDYDQIEVKHNEGAQRYEAQIGEQTAGLIYRRTGNQITYLHTGVPAALEGHGIGGKLAHRALEDARAQHLSVIPACSFIAAYIRRHPEYRFLLSAAE